MLCKAKKISIITIIFIFAFMGVVTASEAQYGGTLRVAVTSSPPGLDPMVNTHIATREIAVHVFEPLVAFNENYKVVPMLANDWEIKNDGKTYIFNLRKGVVFHNGKIMKAEDVKASIERYLMVSPLRDNLDVLKEINIIDDYTVEMILEESQGAFLANLGQPGSLLPIMPKEIVEGAERGELDEIIGTGPYQISEWKADQYVEITRFEDYKPYEGMEASGFAGHKKAYLDAIRFIPVEEAGSRVAGLETEAYDFADFLPEKSIDPLKEQEGLVIDDLMPYTWPVIYFSHSEDSILSNLKLRKAIQAGIDHEEIMTASSYGSHRLDPGLYFEEQVWHSDVGKELYNQNNSEKAKRLMREAGYDGEEIVILTNTSYDYMYKAGIVLEQQLKNLGFNVKLQVTDWATQLDIRADLSKWDISFSSHSIRFDPVINNHYFMPETSFIGYNNPEHAEALRKAMRSPEFETRYKYYEKAQKLFYENVPMIKLYDMGIWQGWQEYVKNYEPWYMIYFVGTWLDK